MSHVNIKVLRAICIGGEVQAVGKVLEVSPALAAELVAYGKAERVSAEDKPTAKAAARPSAKNKEQKK